MRPAASVTMLCERISNVRFISCISLRSVLFVKIIHKKAVWIVFVFLHEKLGLILIYRLELLLRRIGYVRQIVGAIVEDYLINNSLYACAHSLLLTLRQRYVEQTDK